MTEARVAECPFGGAKPFGAKLGGTPFDEVERVFADCSGFYDLSHKKSLNGDRVVTRFNPEQRPYVTTVSTYLNALLKGVVFAKEKQPVERFSQRVIRNFTKQNEGKLCFTEALLDSWYEVICDFVWYYPNLFPAIYAVEQRTGLSLGIASAIESAVHFLQRARIGVDISQEGAINPESFVTSSIDNPSGTVISCMGISGTITSIDESRLAALQLVAENQTRDYSGNSIYHPTLFRLIELLDQQRLLLPELLSKNSQERL